MGVARTTQWWYCQNRRRGLDAMPTLWRWTTPNVAWKPGNRYTICTQLPFGGCWWQYWLRSHRSTVPFYIENSEGIVVNEHLCYVYNRTDIIPHVELVNIVSQFYNDAQICAALTVLNLPDFCQLHPQRRRLPKRIGKDKKIKPVDDICVLMYNYSAALVDAPAAGMPSFVAFKLARLPAVDSSHFDVSTLSQQIHKLQTQVNDIRSSAVKDRAVLV